MTHMAIYHPGDIFEEYVKRNPIEMGIFLEFTVPYYLLLNSGFYEFSVDDKFFAPYLNKPRKISFELDSRFHENQSVPLRESTFMFTPNDLNIWNYKYSVFNSGFRILIETYYDEKQKIMDELEKDARKITIDLMQACLEFVLFRYNETSGGVHAITPSVYDCSHLSFNLVYSNFIIEKMTFTGNNNIIEQIDDKEFKLALNTDIVVWRTFINESKYAYKTYDYKKSIIYTAVAFETYITSFIYKNVPQPNTYETSDGGNFLTIKPKISKLLDDGLVKTNLTKKELFRLVNDIAFPRNDLMHGKVFEFTNLRGKALKAIEAFEKIMVNWIL